MFGMSASNAARFVLIEKAKEERIAARTWDWRSARSEALSWPAAERLGVQDPNWRLPGSRGEGGAGGYFREARRKTSQLEREAAGTPIEDAEDKGFVFNPGGGWVPGMAARTLKAGDAVWCYASLPFGPHHALTYVRNIDRWPGKKGLLIHLGSGRIFSTQDDQLEKHFLPLDIGEQVIFLEAGLVQKEVSIAWVCRLLKNYASGKVLCGDCETAQRITTCSLMHAADGTPETLHGFRRWKCQRCFEKKKCSQRALSLREQVALQARGSLVPEECSYFLQEEYIRKPPWRRMGANLPSAADDPAPPPLVGCRPKAMAKSQAKPPATGLVRFKEQSAAKPTSLLQMFHASPIQEIAETLKKDAKLRAVVDARILAPLRARVSVDALPMTVDCKQLLEDIDKSLLEQALQKRPNLAKIAEAVVRSPASFARPLPTGAFFDNAASGGDLEKTAEKLSELAVTVLASQDEPQSSARPPAGARMLLPVAPPCRRLQQGLAPSKSPAEPVFPDNNIWELDSSESRDGNFAPEDAAALDFLCSVHPGLFKSLEPNPAAAENFGFAKMGAEGDTAPPSAGKQHVSSFPTEKEENEGQRKADRALAKRLTKYFGEPRAEALAKRLGDLRRGEENDRNSEGLGPAPKSEAFSPSSVEVVAAPAAAARCGRWPMLAAKRRKSAEGTAIAVSLSLTASSGNGGGDAD